MGTGPRRGTEGTGVTHHELPVRLADVDEFVEDDRAFPAGRAFSEVRLELRPFLKPGLVKRPLQHPGASAPRLFCEPVPARRDLKGRLKHPKRSRRLLPRLCTSGAAETGGPVRAGLREAAPRSFTPERPDAAPATSTVRDRQRRLRDAAAAPQESRTAVWLVACNVNWARARLAPGAGRGGPARAHLVRCIVRNRRRLPDLGVPPEHGRATLTRSPLRPLTNPSTGPSFWSNDSPSFFGLFLPFFLRMPNGLFY